MAANPTTSEANTMTGQRSTLEDFKTFRDNVLDGAFCIPHDSPPRFLLVLTAYLETGQEQDDWMFIAGYLGDDAGWEKFPDLWAKAIGPQRKHLHMKELRFTKLSVQKILAKAALVPKECGLIPIAAGVRFKDYADIILDERDSLIHAAYMQCCRAVTIFAMRALPENERLEIVFERQDQYGWLAELEFQKIASTMDQPQLLMADGKTSKLANWRFIEKKDTVLCEPADYLAYALLQHSRNKKSIKSRWTYPIIAAQPNSGAAALLQREHVGNVILGEKKETLLALLHSLKQRILDEEAKRKNSEHTTEQPGI
jgi:hypothetical protein